MSAIQQTLRLTSIDRDYCWSGIAPSGKKTQMDLLIESNPVRTDYLCEMKFSEGKYPLTQNEADGLTNRIAAFSASKMHKVTHSIQVIMVTTMGLHAGNHSGIVDKEITLDDLFKSQRNCG